MVGLSIPFTATNSSYLAVWSRFGTSTLFKARLLLLYVLVLPNSSRLVASFYVGPMNRLWTYTEKMLGLSLSFKSTNSSKEFNAPFPPILSQHASKCLSEQVF